MNKKSLVIQVLKQRITTMQQQITKLENEKLKEHPRSKSKSLSKSKDISQSPIRYTSSNKRYKSPTFWTANPLLGQQNPYFSQNNISPTKKIERNRSFTTKSPFLQKIKKQTDQNFYQSAPINQKSNSKQVLQKQNCFEINAFVNGNFSRKDDNSRHMLRQIKNIIKVEKKKTYDLPRKDPILNPEPNKVSCRKIQFKEQGVASPKNMYIQNPRSNPNLYFYQTQPITLSPKVNNNRNNSPDLKLLLSNSLQKLQKCNLTPSSNKKHYGKYYHDNLASKWSINW